MYFWRDHRGLEIDVVVDQADRLIPIEVKAGATVNTGFFTSVKNWQALAGSEGTDGWVVFGGGQSQVRGRIRAIPWKEIGILLDSLVVS